MKLLKWQYGTSPDSSGFFWNLIDSNGDNQKKSEWLQVKRNNPVVAQNIYQANPGNRQGAVFLEEYFTYFLPPDNLHIGIAASNVQEFVGKGAYVVQGWDTAFSASTDADHSVCTTGLMMPCNKYHCGEDEATYGPCEDHFDVLVLDVWREKVNFAGVQAAMRAQYQKWMPTAIVVEKRAYATAALEALESSGMPLIGVNPIEGKRARAVEGLGGASTQGWFKQHRVAFPAIAPWLDALEVELKDFTGERGGKDDQVDALVHMVNFAIREGTSAGRFPVQWDSVEKIDRLMSHADNPIESLFTLSDATFESLLNSGFVTNPFDQTCSHCKHYQAEQSFCGFHKRRFPAISICDDFSSTTNSFNFR